MRVSLLIRSLFRCLYREQGFSLPAQHLGDSRPRIHHLTLGSLPRANLRPNKMGTQTLCIFQFPWLDSMAHIHTSLDVANENQIRTLLGLWFHNGAGHDNLSSQLLGKANSLLLD